jgi:TonB family protein
MKRRDLYTWISAGFHISLALLLSGIGFTSDADTETDLSLVYRVNIVTRAPAHGKKGAAALATPMPEIPSLSELKALSEVMKEKALPRKKPDLKPPAAEPPETKAAEQDVPQPTSQDSRDVQNPPSAEGQAMAGGAGESSDIVMLWKQQVRAQVENTWKAPQGVVLPGTSIVATYLLHISGTGELLNMSLASSSGNAPFDRSIELALSSIGRLPPPPPVMMAGRMSVELTLSFSPPREEGSDTGGS